MKYDQNGVAFIDLGGGNLVRLEREELEEKDREKARVELRETPDVKEKAFKQLSTLLQGTYRGLFIQKHKFKSLLELSIS